MSVPDRPVVVVGAGISGVACARELHDAGVPVRLIDRGRRIGGRMAVRTELIAGAAHPVDVGAAYFTVRDPGFARVANGWRDAGLAGEWTDTFHVIGPAGISDATTTGITRWACPLGLRALVEDLAAGIPVTTGVEVEEVDLGPEGLSVDGAPARAVVLAMPEPQAYDLLPEPVAESLGLGLGLDWSPSIAVWAGWPARWWPDFDGAFVDGSPIVSWIADDGRRRGDDAPVLAAHTTSVFAAARLEEPETAVRPVLAEVGRLLGDRPVPPPLWVRAHRWALAAPRFSHDAPFGLHSSLVGVCGDAWGPRARVEQAWRSGHELGCELLRRLAA